MAEHIGQLRGQPAEAAVQSLAEVAVARRGEVVARVSAATELSDAQQTRLTEVLSRIYGHPVTSQIQIDPELLGREPRLVLHGGGNTSVKTTLPDLLGEAVEALCIKASGGDMAAAEPAALPALRLERLRKLHARPTLSDDGMLRILRDSLLE